MAVTFHVLLGSDAPLSAEFFFTAIPMVIWIFAALAIFKEYHEESVERRKENQTLKEAKRILDTKVCELQERGHICV